MSSIQLSRIHYPVTNLGFGTRIGIWFQGCAVRCRGCVSVDTWPSRPETAVDVSWILETIAPQLVQADGVTISGGEPTDQPEALAELLRGIRMSAGPNHDVLVYTGRSATAALSLAPVIATYCDALVAGPFEQDLASPSSGLRGSTNQVVACLSALGTSRYADADLRYSAQRQEIGLHVDEDSVWLVGIPPSGDLAQLEVMLDAQGVHLRRKSWLT
ncbi:4Fe-4S single cluster domain-containing protein [Gordonia alkanivorans]|uniref:4Fe-4S single cluster domain-containing protein n=1 Tax=Gordonia alkanivorans TaxID=84096 RepID=UPI001F4D943F|nr:4Fe-4S single cluster domain-containing protein [Gordonia alkanivorans]